jgi:hypothetical protein
MWLHAGHPHPCDNALELVHAYTFFSALWSARQFDEMLKIWCNPFAGNFQ